MGRVDEAMRRAAGAAVAPQTGDLDVATFDAAMFPAEAGGGDESDARIDGMPAPVRRGEPSPEAPAKAPSAFGILPDALASKIVTDDMMPAASREQYRRLAAALHHAQAANGTRVVLVASAVASEGKTLTAANLALTLSESYERRVLVIDGDLRRPAMHQAFKLEVEPGLTDSLRAEGDPRLPLHPVSPRLTVLCAGRPTSDPIGALTSERMARLIAEAREVFDWVIVDTPPVGLMTDASLLSAMADAAVMVIRADSTPYVLAQRAVNALGKEKVLGIVLNRATAATPAYGYAYYNDYYGASARPRQIT